jgi:small subunit ribosomal protein S17
MADEDKNENEETTEPEAEQEDPPEEPTAEEPAAEAEEPPTAEEEPEPAAEEEPQAEEPAAEAEESAAEAAAEEPAPAPARKPKRKRLPRSQRHKHSKPKRERPAERRPIVRLPKPERARGRSQERRGVVVSSAMDKTIVVKVDTIKAHPKYKKVVRRSAKFHAHDEQNAAKVGDLVRIVETRPLSKNKNWRLAEVLEEAQ